MMAKLEADGEVMLARLKTIQERAHPNLNEMKEEMLAMMDANQAKTDAT
jgi:hypothetical protein